MAEYIDREAFLEHMMGTSRYFTVKFDIENFPSADVTPVVHGQWEKRGCSWYCTCCGNGYRITCGTIPASRHKYCPNCGAKMDKGDG